ncbi:unnamed protein product [Acanthoscelides obtectus]|uniref:Uncharacterized protein n=1 Tax=Acanthoscelides obtectus TaxID=200917 RepID=A0A9P0KJS2_ACAOB|nr:unnamed protein product [Acanthoscelides obtectus]CAK1640902.1 hypothetical protein AOBTE_LOCUS12010 [Acanthoscelides obtectus]
MKSRIFSTDLGFCFCLVSSHSANRKEKTEKTAPNHRKFA